MLTENQKEDVQEKIIFNKDAQKAIEEASNTLGIIKHFFYCPMRKVYGIIIKTK